MALLDTLQKKQKCLVDVIRSLKPQYDCSEEVADLSYFMVCKYEEWFCSNKAEIEKLSNQTGIEVEIDEYWREEEILYQLKTMYEEYLLSLPFIHPTSLDEAVEAELKKQSCMLYTAAALQPVTAINQEQIELYDHVLTFLDGKFNQNRFCLSTLLDEKEYRLQVAAFDQFKEILNRHRSILSGNLEHLINLERLCS